MKRKIVETNDGSKTIYIHEMDENYHSTHGAIQEALHVFIENGLKTLDKKTVSIFELGFGTGLNALLTLQYAQQNSINIFYHGIEAFPIEKELIDSLNYVELTGAKFQSEFELLHQSTWSEKNQISLKFELLKTQSKIEDFKLNKEKYDIIYFDAFGFRAQPEMWELSILEKMYHMLNRGGVLVTYAARGQFKRDLKTLGFEVESLPGPPGKREMTRAIKV